MAPTHGNLKSSGRSTLPSRERVERHMARCVQHQPRQLPAAPGQRRERTGAANLSQTTANLSQNHCPRNKSCPERQGGDDGKAGMMAGRHGSRARETRAPPRLQRSERRGRRQRRDCAGPARPRRRAAARPYLVPVVSGQLGLGEEPHGGLGRRPEAQLGLGAGGRRQQEQQAGQRQQQAGQRQQQQARQRAPGRSARHGGDRAPPPACGPRRERGGTAVTGTPWRGLQEQPGVHNSS